MKKDRIFFFLKGLILLSPLPFGCVGRIFSPLFYVLLLLITFFGLDVVWYEKKTVKGRKVVNTLSPLYSDFRKIHALPGGEWLTRFFTFFTAFILFQVIPLPVAVLKIISPATVRTLEMFRDPVPAFFPVSMVPAETIIFGLKSLVFILFFWVFINIKMEKREIISLVNVMILSGSIQALFGLVKYFLKSGNFFLLFHPVESTEKVLRLTGTLGNQNHFAFFLEMLLPMAVALLFMKLNFFSTSLSVKEKFLAAMNADWRTQRYVVAILLLGVSIFLTGSRGGMVSLVLSFLVFAQLAFYLKQSGLMRKRLRLILVVITVAAVLMGFQNLKKRFSHDPMESQGRILRLANTTKMIADYPLFGTGFGTYRYAYFLYDTNIGAKWSTHAHNDLMETVSDGGAVGGLLFFCLFGSVVLSMFRIWIMRNHKTVKMVGLGILSGLFAVIFHSFFDFSLRIPSNMLFLMLLLILGFQMVTYRKERFDSTPENFRGRGK